MATKAATRSRNGADAIDSKVALRVLASVQRGDFSVRMPTDWSGSAGKVAAAINDIIESNQRVEREIRRLSREVGTEGKLGGQAHVRGVAGVWKDLTDNVNLMAGNLTSQVRNIAEVTTAVQQGDLSKKITVDVRGEILELKQTINTMVDQLNAFANE